MHIGLLFLVALIIFKIIFFKENLLVLLGFVASLFWLFVLPGYVIMIYWREKLEFMERFVIGVALAAAIIAIFSYYLGLIGINIKYHGIIMPLALIIIGAVTNLRKQLFS